MSDPTAGAKMKSISPSVDKMKAWLNLILIVCLSKQIRTLNNIADQTNFPPEMYKTTFRPTNMEELKRSHWWGWLVRVRFYAWKLHVLRVLYGFPKNIYVTYKSSSFWLGHDVAVTPFDLKCLNFFLFSLLI